MPKLEVYSDAGNVLVTLGIAFLGSFAAVSLLEQYRLAALSSAQSRRYFVLFLVAASLGWACVWCVYCFSLASMKLMLDGEAIPVRFNRALIITAAFQSVTQTFIGLAISASDPCFNNTRKEIMEKFIAKASHSYTIEQVRKMSKLRLLFIVCTHSLERLIFGGVFGGIGVAVTQLIIMQSMSFQGSVEFSPGVVAASVIFSLCFGTIGFWVFFRFLSIYSSLEYVRLLLAGLAVATVCGMRFIAGAATSFTFDPSAAPPSESDTISQGDLYSMAVASSVIFAVMMFVFTLFDLRSWLLRTSTQLRQADKALNALMKRTAQLQLQLQQQQQASSTKTTATITSAASTPNRPQAMRRAPSEVLKYTRKFQSSKNMLDTAPSSSTSLGASSKSSLATAPGPISEQVCLHSMYNDYEDEDGNESEDDHEYSVAYGAGSAAERLNAPGTPSGSDRHTKHRKVSIIRNNSFGNVAHNLGDLENQHPAVTLSDKPKPQQMAGANSHSNSNIHSSGTVVPVEAVTEGDVETTRHIYHA